MLRLPVIVLLLLCTGCHCQGIYAQNVGINQPSPDANSVLDVVATDKGVLLPRIDWNNRPTTPTNGLLLYVETNCPGTGCGFYYYDGAWIKLGEGTEPGGNAGGDLTGTYPNPDIAANAVGNSEMADNAVGSAEIIDDALVNADINANADIAVSKLAGGTNGQVLTTNGSGTPVWGDNMPAGDGDYIQNQTASDQSADFRISGNGLVAGNMGIGSTSPDAKLDVEGEDVRLRLTESSWTTSDEIGIEFHNADKSITAHFDNGMTLRDNNRLNFVEGGVEVLRITDENLRLRNDRNHGLVWGTGTFTGAFSKIEDDGNLEIKTDDVIEFMDINTTNGDDGTLRMTLNTNTGQLALLALGGSGTQMVTADNNGVLGVATLPTNDDLGDHTADQDINMQDNSITDAEVVEVNTLRDGDGGTQIEVDDNLNMAGDIGLADNRLFLRAIGDNNHYLEWESGADGPRLQGNLGGELGTATETPLTWSNSGVSIGGGTDMEGVYTGTFAVGNDQGSGCSVCASIPNTQNPLHLIINWSSLGIPNGTNKTVLLMADANNNLYYDQFLANLRRMTSTNMEVMVRRMDALNAGWGLTSLQVHYVVIVR